MATAANITRRASLVGALASSAVLAVPAIAAVNHTSEPDELVGLPLAAHHIEAAIAAMADVTFGKWEVTIRSGEPDQSWGFKQLPAHPNERVRRLGREIMEALRDPEFIGGLDHVIITRNYVGYSDGSGVRQQDYMVRKSTRSAT